MNTKKKIAIALGSVLAIAGLVVLILWLRGLGKPVKVTVTPTPTPSLVTRGVSNDKFGPRARLQSTANVDVGVRTIGRTPTPKASGKPKGQYYQAPPNQQPQQYISPSPQTSAQPRTQTVTTPAPLPLAAPPTFAPLPPPPAGNGKEAVIVFAKGESQKRQIYLRSLERDKDEQLVSDVYDDFGVSFSGSAQKVAFYSNEEGPSDATRGRSKLKVVDLATGKVFTIASGLPGSWPAVWSPDGKKIAIPTANSIFIADTTTGRSLQVPTSTNPGAISWSPGSVKFYYQAEKTPQNTDVFEADAITAQAKTVVDGPTSETYPAVSNDGALLSFLRDQSQTETGPALVVKNLKQPDEKTYPQTQPILSYLWNLEYTDLLFVQASGQAQLKRSKNQNISQVGALANPALVSWDRDYQHVFVLADDNGERALYSVDINTGQPEKMKSGIADVPELSQR